MGVGGGERRSLDYAAESFTHKHHKEDDLLNRLLNNESYFNIEIIALFNHCCLPVTFEFLNGKFPEYEIYQGLFKMLVKKYIYCR